MDRCGGPHLHRAQGSQGCAAPPERRLGLDGPSTVLASSDHSEQLKRGRVGLARFCWCICFSARGTEASRSRAPDRAQRLNWQMAGQAMDGAQAVAAGRWPTVPQERHALAKRMDALAAVAHNAGWTGAAL